jgi:hypothetical protein
MANNRIVPFLSFEALALIEQAGWNEVGIQPMSSDTDNIEHVFEDETRALQLVITGRAIAGDRWANVWSAFFYHGGRTRYPVAPIVHAEYAEGRLAANTLRDELQFLKVDGVRLSYASLHRTTAFEKKRTVVEGYYIGGKA